MPRKTLTVWRWPNGWQFIYGKPERYLWVSWQRPFFMRSGKWSQRTDDETI